MDSTAFLARATLLCQQLVNKSLTQPLNRQLSKPNASWDYQWSASNNKSSVFNMKNGSIFTEGIRLQI